MGYVNSFILETDPPFIKYYLHGKKPIIFTSVGIIKNHKMSKFSALENSEKMLTEYRHKSEDGWLSVEIEQSVQHNRLIAEIKHFFTKLRGSE
ncbi:MAG: hypothetical protein JXA96_10705 [Sedimentisphaerales bacterium]|nr:hypothetical protein [Sedimentisphaerales bacterium]